MWKHWSIGARAGGRYDEILEIVNITSQAVLDSADDARRAGIAALILFAFVFITHMASPVRHVCDSRYELLLAVNLLDGHGFAMDHYLSPDEFSRDYRLRITGSSVYAGYPWGGAVFISPLVFVARPFLEWYLGADLTVVLKSDPIDALLEVFFGSWLVALATASFFFAIRRSIAAGRNQITWSLGLSLVFAFCTSVWSSASRAMWQQTPSLLLVTAALHLLVLGRNRLLWLVLAGLPMGMAVSVRPTNILFFASAMFCLAIARPKALLPCLGMAAISAGPVLFAHYTHFGSFLTPVYSLYSITWSLVLPTLISCLFSPNRGLLVFTPILCFSIHAIVVKARKWQWDFVDGIALLSILLHLGLLSTWGPWYGGHCYGPRLFFENLPSYAWFLVPAWEIAAGSKSKRNLFLAAVAISFFIHLQGAFRWKTAVWNRVPTLVEKDQDRFWDWRDPQILRGLPGFPPPAGPPAGDETKEK